MRPTSAVRRATSTTTALIATALALAAGASARAQGVEDPGTALEEPAAGAPPAPAAAVPGLAAPVPALATFAERQRWILDQAIADPAAASHDHPFFVAEACFQRGEYAKGAALARAGYLAWSARDPEKVRATDFFRLWPAMDCYVRWKDRLDAESSDAFKRFMTRIRCYSYSYTPNLSLLMWTTRLLGGQEWGDEAFVPAARDTTSHYRADPDLPMRARLLAVVDAQARGGGEEYASRPYGAANLAPILCLAQLAVDAQLKAHARIAHETTLARYAPVWLDGALAITSRRSYPDLFNDPLGVAEWFWVFFGGSMRPGAAGHALEAAVLGAAPPPLIAHAAQDRDSAYEVRNRFQEASHARQVSWIDRSYGLFSESFVGDPRPLGQTYPCGVRWLGPSGGPFTLLWFGVPIVDEQVPGAYPGSHPHGWDVNGQSTWQHRDALLYVCRTDGRVKARYPYGLGFVPGGAQAVIDEAATAGRIFLHYPGVLIAFSASKPFPWDRTAPIRYATAPPRPGDSEFRVHGPLFAAAIETARAADLPGADPAARLAAFRAQVGARSSLRITGGDDPTGVYTTRAGTVISRVFGGAAAVDGRAVDLAGWPLAASPWVAQARAGEPLVVTDGRASLTYDLQAWTITATEP